tara:strand:- start:514 stop:897 length:384 start_codon:yes stop_codon:yes gene_type:complete
MDFEGIVCPACAYPLEEEMLENNLKCKNCATNLKQKKFLGFLEYLMMQGIVSNLDFFDESLYERESDEGKELLDETDPNEYEDKSEQFERYEDSINADKNITDEEEFREWDGVEDDWQEFNKKKNDK